MELTRIAQWAFGARQLKCAGLIMVFCLLFASQTFAATLDDARNAMEAKEFDRARQLLQLEVDAGDSEAMFLMGTLYDGGALPGGISEALKYYEMAAAAGHATAQHQCGFLYLSGPEEIRDPAKASRWFRQAAGNGIGISMFMLGRLYATGQGGAVDLNEAVKWYQAAAEKDIPGAQYQLARGYLEGSILEKNPPKALYWLERAAGNGFSGATLDIARLYLAGAENIPADSAKAASWLLPAANSGDAEARYLLGGLYIRGEGVERNPDKGAALLGKAALGGLADAQYEIGRRLAEGLAGTVDKVEAGAWWQVASDLGQEQARERLSELKDSLSPAEQQRSSARAEEIHRIIGR